MSSDHFATVRWTYPDPISTCNHNPPVPNCLLVQPNIVD